MITTNQTYDTALEADVGMVRARFLIDGVPLSCLMMGVKVYKGCCGGDLTCGSAFATYIDATVRDCAVALEGEVLELQIGFAPDISDPSTIEWATIGHYAVASTKKAGAALSFTAFGTLATKCGGEYTSALTYPATIGNIITEIQNATGITVQWQGVSGGFLAYPVTKKFEGIAYREALGYIAGLCGGYVTDTSGQDRVVIGTYLSGAHQDISPRRSQTAPEYSEDVFTVTGVSCTVKPEEPDETGEGTIPAVVYTHGDPNVSFSNPYMTEALFNNFCVPNIEGIAFYPAAIQLTVGDCRLEGMDYVVVTDMEGVQRAVPCMAVTHDCTGGLVTQIDASAVTSDAGESAESGGEVTRALSTIIADAVNTKQAAARAQHSADEAAQAASDAQGSADIAAGAASDAQTSADQAQVSADNANEYAARALGNLSTVQSVSETLTWITQHGTMTLTQDTEPDPTHVYFVVDANGDYTVNSTTYSIVTEPVAANMGSYYELTIDESLNNYVGTHLALTSEGLWLLPASSGTNKVLIATGAGSTYTAAGTYIVDSNGDTVACFGTTALIGKAGQTNAEIDYHSLQLTDKEGDVYFHISDLRGSDGLATVSQTEIGVNQAAHYYLILTAANDNYTVYVDGVETTPTSKDTSGFVLPAQTVGAQIKVTYQTDSQHAKAYTLGVRGNGDVGGMSFVGGSSCDAAGHCSHAEGIATKARSECAHAEGRWSKAYGYASHAEGWDTEATDHTCHAEGDGTVASGYCSHTEGKGSVASGDYSHAQNWNTKAASAHQTVIGKYNKVDNADKYALIIGNGSSEVARDDALTVEWDGQLECKNVGAPVDISNDFSITKTSGNSTCTVRNAVRSGNMIMLGLSFKCTSAYTAQNLSNHANLFVGTVPAKYKPACTTSGVGYIDSQAVVAHISGTSTRQITVRPTAQLDNGKEPYIYFTYFI